MNEIKQQLAAYLQQWRNGEIDDATYESLTRPLITQYQTANPNDPGILEYSLGTLQRDKAVLDQAAFDQKILGLTGALEGAAALTQGALAFDQIRTAQQAARQSTMPQLPQVPGPNVQLSEQLYDAQRRANDIGYAINPAVQQLNQGYTQALGQAQAASGGQASNFQALANLANQQRMQSALQLVPMAQQARMQNQEQVNQLLGQRMQEQHNMFANQMQQYQYPYEQFNLQQQAIGALGSQGRTRAFDVISRLPEYLEYLPFDDKTNSFIQKTNLATQDRLNGVRNRQGSGMTSTRPQDLKLF